MKTFEFWYDFSSPYAYLGATQVAALEARTGARALWRPFLLGGLFHAIGGPEVPMMTWPDPKRRYTLLDISRHANFYGVPFRWPSTFPMLTVAPLRLALAVPPEDLPRVSLAIYRAYWAADRDIKDPKELSKILESLGLPTALLEKTQDPAIKEALKVAGQEALKKGLCGAPTYVVGDMVIWGQDRQIFVERALAGWRPACG